MKTSVIEVHDMLSVLSVVGVEKRIGEVPGVESVTVNFAAGSATVRYDETRLHVADIKADVRQRAYESTGTSIAAVGDKEQGKSTPASEPSMPVAVERGVAETAAVGNAKPKHDSAHEKHAAALPAEVKPAEAAPNNSTPAAAKPDDVKPAGGVGGHQGHGAEKTDAMAQEMGHGGGQDMQAMVRDMRNRFWIALGFSVPIFAFAPMGMDFIKIPPPY